MKRIYEYVHLSFVNMAFISLSDVKNIMCIHEWGSPE